MNETPDGSYTTEELALIGGRDGLAGIPPPFADRWVLYVDIAGFTARLRDKTLRAALAHAYWDIARGLSWGSRHHRVLDIAQRIHGRETEEERLARQTEALRQWRASVRIFSDSIFIFFRPRSSGANVSSPDYTLDARHLPSAAASLCRALWSSGLTHKGGIAFGSCFLDSELNVALGDAIVDAVQWERRQEWFGISVAPGALERAKADFESRGFLFNGNAPVAGSGATETTLIVDPTDTKLFVLREGRDLQEDPCLDGFLRAVQTPAPSEHKEKVDRRFKATARIWTQLYARNGVTDADLRAKNELDALLT